MGRLHQDADAMVVDEVMHVGGCESGAAFPSSCGVFAEDGQGGDGVCVWVYVCVGECGAEMMMMVGEEGEAEALVVVVVEEEPTKG